MLKRWFDGIKAYSRGCLRYGWLVRGWVAKGEVSTIGNLDCDAQRAWEKVCFYEHITRQPSWLLRTALPTPQRATGSYRRVGDVSRCMYSDGGYLTKRITRIVRDRQIHFDIVEQTIRYQGTIVLRGGRIEIEARDDGTSGVRMLTRYELRFPSFWVGRFAVNFVVAAMHRVVIRDMQDRLRHSAALPATQPCEGLEP